MKNIKTELRRAFTIVELVIVIVVIAALAAVLIPTFANVMNAANESADTSMLKNVNTAINAENVLGDIKTPSQALDVAADNGYNIEKLTPSSDGDIVYDQLTTSFALIDSEGETVYSKNGSDVDPYAPTTWYIVTSADQMTCSTCSYILNGEFVTADSASTTSKSAVSSTRKAAMDNTVASVSSEGVLKYTGMGGLNTYECSGITEISYTYSEAESYVNYYSEKSVNLTFNIGLENAVKVTLTLESDITIDSYSSSNTITTVSGSYTLTVNDYNGSVYQGASVTWNGTEGTEIISGTKVDTTDGVLQMGTEKYPYLVNSDSFAVEEKSGGNNFRNNYFTKISSSAYGVEGTITYFKLIDNVTITQNYSAFNAIKCDVVFDLNNYTISIIYPTTASSGGFSFGNKSTGAVTFKNGTLKTVDDSGELNTISKTCLTFEQCSKVTVEYCNFYQVGIKLVEGSSGSYVNEIYFNECEFTYNDGVRESGSTIVARNPLLSIGKVDTVTLKNCTINADAAYTIDCATSSHTINLINVKWYNTSSEFSWNVYTYTTAVISASVPSYVTLNVDSNCEFYHGSSSAKGTQVDAWGNNI